MSIPPGWARPEPEGFSAISRWLRRALSSVAWAKEEAPPAFFSIAFGQAQLHSVPGVCRLRVPDSPC